MPRRPGDPAAASWASGSHALSAGGSVWAPMSADPARDLIFLPTAGPTAAFTAASAQATTSTPPQWWRYARRPAKWSGHFQTTHHDIWDYDVAAQPTLATLRRDDRDIRTKMGFVFALERETGKPIFPIEERPVPASDVPGEQLSPTQPHRRRSSCNR